jgi:hypothetical protein
MGHQMPAAALESTAVLYRIDDHDVIVETGGGWDAFAAENGTLHDVAGASLWDSVSGTDVRAIWGLLLGRVRSGRSLSFQYRCDAPGMRRLMQMELSPDGAGGVRFSSQPVQVDLAETLAGRPWEDGETVVVCGWCGRVRLDGWVSTDEAITRLGLLGRERSPQLTHGICEPCARELGSI